MRSDHDEGDDEGDDEGAAQEFRLLRHRLGDLEKRLHRKSRDVTPWSPVLVGQVFDDGAMPTTVPAYFACRPVNVGGAEAEGSAGVFDVMTGAKSYVLVLGSTVPDVGDKLLARGIDGRWVARKDGAEEVLSGPGVGTVCFHFYAGCPRPGGVPALSVFTVREGSPSPVNGVENIDFGGTPTGGTFRVWVDAEITAAIAWSPDNATLAANLLAALEALAGIAPGDAIVTVGIMTAGVGNLYIEWTGTRGGTGAPGFTLHSNSLTGASHPIGTTQIRTPAANVDERQHVIFPPVSAFGTTPTGGTFKLEFDGETTADIAYSSTSATLDANILAALKALPNVADADVNIFNQVVQFQDGLGAQDVPTMTIADNSLAGNRQVPLDFAEITLLRDGVVVGTGTTNADGNVAIPTEHFGAGFTIEIVHALCYPDAYQYGTLSRPGATSRAELQSITYREVPILFRFFEGDGITRKPGVVVTLAGQSGTAAAGWTAGGTSDAAGEVRAMAPNQNPSYPTTVDSNFDYTITQPEIGIPSEFEHSMTATACGGYAEGAAMGPLPPSEWPL